MIAERFPDWNVQSPGWERELAPAPGSPAWERQHARALPKADRGGDVSGRRTECGLTPLDESEAVLDRRLQTVRLGDVVARPIDWLWKGRIARGRLCLLAGDPGVGKSMLTHALAAAVSTGAALPGDSDRTPADVVILSAEDSPEDTIRPRCESMGADLRRIRVVTAVERFGSEKFFSLADDLDALEPELEGVALVIVDPIDAYVGMGTDTHRAAAIRSLLGPLAAMAQRANVAVVVVQHLTKGTRERAIYRPQGSIGYIAAARTALLVAPDPDRPASPVRMVALLKTNLGPLVPTLAFSLDGGHFEWVPCDGDKTAEQLLAVSADADDGGALTEAERVLRMILADGPVPVRDVRRQAEEAGVSEATLRRARRGLGVEAQKRGFGAGASWVLSLPPEGVAEPLSGEIQLRSDTPPNLKDAHVGHSERLNVFGPGRTAAAQPGQHELEL